MEPEIPGYILKKLYCDVCRKSLSVLPVKVFPGKIIKCGRCCEDRDEGLVSLYGIIANLYRFPCVNRYDGCQELLVPAQVAAHEKNCKTKLHACRNCWDNEQVPTHLMIEHYREKHKENLLETPDFNIEVNEPLPFPGEKLLLYKLEDKLFLIKCLFFDDTVTLNASCLGDYSKKEKITKKFILYYGSSRISTEEMPCLPHSEAGKRVRLPNLTSVCFQIKIYRNLLSEVSVAEQVEGESMVISSRQSSLSVQPSKLLLSSTGKRKSAALITKEFREDDLIKPRIVSNSSGRKMDLLIYFADLDYQYFVHNNKKKKMYFRCFKCAEMKYSISDLVNVNVLTAEKKAYLYCEVCHILASKLQLLNSYTITGLMGFSAFRQIQFFCLWHCNKSFSMDNILKHEIACNKQPARLCPVEWCLMNGKLIEIKRHFEEHAPEYSLSFDSDIVVDLDPTKPPIKQFLLVRNAFVFIELTWIKCKWQMKFVLCGEKDTFAGMKLKAMAFDYYNSHNFLGSAEQPQCIEFASMEAVRIKCFLEE